MQTEALRAIVIFSQKFTPEKKHSMNNLPLLFFFASETCFPCFQHSSLLICKICSAIIWRLVWLLLSSVGDKSERFNHQRHQGNGFFLLATNDPPSAFFLFHYLLSPWLQEALHIIASSHIVRPRVSFLPWLPPTTWTFPAFVARRSGYLIVKDALWKVLSKQIVMAFITLDSVFSHPKASCWHLFEDLVRSRIKQSCVEMPPLHSTGACILALVVVVAAGLIWKCHIAVHPVLLFHVFARGARWIYSIPTQPGNQDGKGQWK